jgi:DNA-binding transcriptional ArsR family regulator
MAPVLDVEVIADPAAALAALDPVRARLLASLQQPGSATTLARDLGLPRQRINYHLRTLEGHGLVRLVVERPKRGLTERVVVASASSYVVSPEALGDAGAGRAVHRSSTPDRLSARYLLALAARLLREVGTLANRAEASGRSLPTLALDAELRFASARDRARFTEELADAVAVLAARYHDEGAAGGRWHRLVVACHPRPRPDEETPRP